MSSSKLYFTLLSYSLILRFFVESSQTKGSLFGQFIEILPPQEVVLNETFSLLNAINLIDTSSNVVELSETEKVVNAMDMMDNSTLSESEAIKPDSLSKRSGFDDFISEYLCKFTLKTMDCSFANISKLPSQIKVPSVIEQLNFSHNSIATFASKDEKNQLIFVRSLSVKSLDLSYNNLKLYNENNPNNNFESFRSLELLNISNNEIPSLGSWQFKNLESLQLLDLSKNWLENLPDDCFSLFNNVESKLKTLSLSQNRLDRLPSNIFRRLLNLETLDLSHNFLTSLEENLFKFNVHLKHLHLNHNRLSIVTPNLLHGLRLTTLDLSNNWISKIDEKTFQLVDTEELRLNDLPFLRKIEGHSFATLNRLRRLKIENNPILYHISPKAFIENSSDDVEDYSVGLEFISLRGDNLTFLDELMLPWKNISHIDLSSNSWDCRRNISWMAKLKVNNKTINEFTCTRPARLRNILLQDFFE